MSNQQLKGELTQCLTLINSNVEVSKCIIDEDDLLTLTILNHAHEDDRNNVIDLEGVTKVEAQHIIAEKHDRSLPDMEIRALLFAAGMTLLIRT